MEEEPIYHFRFGIRSMSMSIPEHVTTREVPYSKLLEGFDAALDWIMANPEKRYASVFGRGMMSKDVNSHTREYVLKRLPIELLKKQRRYIGLAWMDLDGDHTKGNYKLHKIWTADMRLPDIPDRVIPQYGLIEVDAPDWNTAFRWAEKRGWQDYGVWFRGRPGLIFCPDFEAIAEAFKHIVGVGMYLETGKLERAPVRYGWAAYEDAYPRMKPTRSTPQIQKLRAQYPTAGEDLKVCPLEILIQHYGYSEVRV